MKSDFGFSEWLWAIVVGFILILLPGLSLVRCFGGTGFHYSSGSRSGVVYKFSKKGLIWDTWEGELSLGFFEKDSNGGIVPKIFNFSCLSDVAAKDVEAAVVSGKRVTLYYEEYFLRGYAQGSTGYDVVKVEGLEKEKAENP